MTSSDSQPLVVVTRALWNELSVKAVTATREIGGLVVGRRTRVGSIHCLHSIPLSHKRATDSQVVYSPDEVAHARKVAFDIYGPSLEPVGASHTHPYENRCAAALMPQLSDDDFKEMQDGDVELIIITYPYTKPTPDYRPRSGDMILHRRVGPMIARLEPWLKRGGEAVPCRIRLA